MFEKSFTSHANDNSHLCQHNYGMSPSISKVKSHDSIGKKFIANVRNVLPLFETKYISPPNVRKLFNLA